MMLEMTWKKNKIHPGRCEIYNGVESTIIDLRKKPKILRLGGLDVKNIKNIKKKISFDIYPSKISSPGQLKIHYSPGIPIRLNVKKFRKDEACLFIRKK